jgi:hypothetical protein
MISKKNSKTYPKLHVLTKIKEEKKEVKLITWFFSKLIGKNVKINHN